MKSLSLKNLFAILFILFIGLLAATALQAWTGPTGSAPTANVSAPINVGSTDQVKNAGLSVNALTVFGSQYVQTALGVGRVSPVVALDVNGTIRIANGSEVCQSVTAGAIRYNSTSNTLEYCNGTVWGAIGSGSGGSGSNLSAIRTYTSSATWSKPSGLSYVVVEVWGGGGGGAGAAYPGAAGGTGGTSSFAGVSAGGGSGGVDQYAGGGVARGGAGGVGSAGDVNMQGAGGATGWLNYGDWGFSGVGGAAAHGGGGGDVGSAGGVFGGGGGGPSSIGNADVGGGGGGGGYAAKRIDASALSSSQSVTVGGGGGGGGSGAGAGAAGGVVVYEYSGTSGSGNPPGLASCRLCMQFTYGTSCTGYSSGNTSQGISFPDQGPSAASIQCQ